MKPRYPGLRQITFAEQEEFINRLLRVLPQWNMGYYVHDLDLRNAIARVFNEMVREQEEEPSNGN